MWRKRKREKCDEAVKIGQLDIEHFTRGDCHVLARAIHRLTGWPMHVFWRNDGPGGHAFILTPEGKALDIEGLHEPDEICAKWRCPDYRPITWIRLRSAGWTHHYRTTSLQRARELAPLLVEMAETGPICPILAARQSNVVTSVDARTAPMLIS